MESVNTLAEKTNETEIKKDVILFVCTGNTCRSPMCSALFNHKYAGLTKIASSAGLAADGTPISSSAVHALREFGVKNTPDNDFMSHVSRCVNEKMMKEAFLVVGVSSSHAMSLIMRFPAYASKITSFKRNISDPFCGDDETYRYCLKTIDEAMGEMFSAEKGEADEHNRD